MASPGRLHNPSPKSFGRHFKHQIFSYTQGFRKLHRYIQKYLYPNLSGYGD